MIRKLSNPSKNAADMFALTANGSGEGRGTTLGSVWPDKLFTANCEYNLVSILYTIESTGVNATYTLPAAATSLAEVKAALKVFIESIGYIDPEIDHAGNQYRRGINVEAVDGSNCTITMIGDIRLVSLVDNSGTVAFTVKTTPIYLIDRTYSAIAYSTTASLYLAGDLANAESVTVPATGNEATLKTNIETALTNLGVTNSTVTVTDDTSDYIVTIKAPNTFTELIFVGETSTIVTARTEWIA